MKNAEKKENEGVGFRFRDVLLVTAVLLFLMSLLTHDASDLAVLEGGSKAPLQNWIGPAGAHFARIFLYLFGLAAYPILFLLALTSLRPLISVPTKRRGYVGAMIAASFGITVLAAMWPQNFIAITKELGIGHPGRPFSALSGGVVGQKLAAPELSVDAGLIRDVFGTVGTAVVAVVFLGAGLVFIWLGDWQPVLSAYLELRRQKRKREHPDEELRQQRVRQREERLQALKDKQAERENARREQAAKDEEPEEEPEQVSTVENLKSKKARSMDSSGYMLPPISMLEKVREGSVEDKADTEESKEILQATLDSFNVGAEVVGAVVGPRVTRLEISPAPGVKVEKISALGNNIAMDLQAKSIRIQAPIPGQNAVGIEIPNKTTAAVSIRAMMESDSWNKNRGEIPIILGKDVGGKVVVTDLAKAPHLLIAGATGSGKSVCINALIMSLLYRFTPEELSLILVDPKVVEFEVYTSLPHLITQIVNDPKKVPMALRWAINEMEKRYKILAKAGVRNLALFNSRPESGPALEDEDGNPIERLPYVVIIIDELADIMMIAKSDVETSIARLAQKARAVGIHMVLATQTPRRDIITGVIKANLPTRISFQVTSIVDSRVILDKKGAEALLGRGDMLFIPPGSANMERLQGAMVLDREIENVVKFVSDQGDQVFDEAVISAGADESDEDSEEGGPNLAPEILEYVESDDGDLYKKALEVVLTDRKASTSYLQRRLKIGYNRAAELIDELEDRGIIGPATGGGAKREILVDPDSGEQA